MREVQTVQGAKVSDTSGKEWLTKFAQPIFATTNDLGPRRIEQRGSALTDNTRRTRLQPYADELERFLRAKGVPVTTATASVHLRQQPGFQIAMSGLPSFGAFVKLFDAFRLETDRAAGGTSKIALV